MRNECKKSIYYWIESSMDTSAAISAACDSFASLISGKLEILEPIICEAYKKRTGREIDEIELEQIQKALKLVQYIGWDSTYGKALNIHGYSQMSDTLFDVSEVLNYQLADDGSEAHKDSKYPLHWNDKIPLCRIVKRTESKSNRNKQLAIFPKK